MKGHLETMAWICHASLLVSFSLLAAITVSISLSI